MGRMAQMQKAPSNATLERALFANESVRLLNHPVLSRAHDGDDDCADDSASPDDVDGVQKKNRIARPV
jgi:hypothetical protein